ncbi:hypothetical protein KIN20_013953 [Parelaphostrongylus tenuis]|uniref:Uncharacterized protein n=1 Tax=Parelaphostrongylus tenuis TaxID=148309 RepID=A0AAD5MGD1_PARTN|nr:hypothetical protein KIN20_013953 [Parelaphostrongylus tenuis]
MAELHFIPAEARTTLSKLTSAVALATIQFSRLSAIRRQEDRKAERPFKKSKLKKNQEKKVTNALFESDDDNGVVSSLAKHHNGNSLEEDEEDLDIEMRDDFGSSSASDEDMRGRIGESELRLNIAGQQQYELPSVDEVEKELKELPNLQIIRNCINEVVQGFSYSLDAPSFPVRPLLFFVDVKFLFVEKRRSFNAKSYCC